MILRYHSSSTTMDGKLLRSLITVILTCLFFASLVSSTANKKTSTCCSDGLGLNYTLPMFMECKKEIHPNGSMVQKIPKLIPYSEKEAAACPRRKNKLGIKPGHRVCRFPDCDSNPCVNGWCEETMENYKCHCPAGYKGRRCNRKSSTSAKSTTADPEQPSTPQPSCQHPVTSTTSTDSTTKSEEVTTSTMGSETTSTAATDPTLSSTMSTDMTDLTTTSETMTTSTMGSETTSTAATDPTLSSTMSTDTTGAATYQEASAMGSNTPDTTITAGSTTTQEASTMDSTTSDTTVTSGSTTTQEASTTGSTSNETSESSTTQKPSTTSSTTTKAATALASSTDKESTTISVTDSTASGSTKVLPTTMTTQNATTMSTTMGSTISSPTTGGEPTVRIFVTDKDTKYKIFVADLQDELNFTSIPATQKPRFITYDSVDRKIYWTDNGTKRVYRADVDGGNRENVTHEGSDERRGIAINETSRTLYIANISPNRITSMSIGEGSPIPSNETVFVSLGSVEPISLEVAKGYLYWTEKGGRIRRISLDGSGGANALFSGMSGWSLSEPYGLSIRPLSGDSIHIFICDFGKKKPFYIEKADGSIHPYALTNDFQASGSEKFRDITYFNEVLYWTKEADPSSITVMRNYDSASSRSYEIKETSGIGKPYQLLITNVYP